MSLEAAVAAELQGAEWTPSSRLLERLSCQLTVTVFYTVVTVDTLEQSEQC